MDDLNPPLWVADSPNLPQAPAGTPPDATSNFAFLVHSQNTLRNTLPPNVDNASMARQKRRRTSPEDQAILEAEFIKDVKPNKATRKAIADRVRGMGEKEVQIWFQNRRQNVRRRSRPLLPHEMPQSQSLSSDGSHGSDNRDETDADKASENGHLGHSQSMGAELGVTKQQHAGGSGALGITLQNPSNKSSPEDARPKIGQRRLRSLKRSLSGKRLSMTSEGGAKLLNDDESSPSPPRPLPQLTPSLSSLSAGSSPAVGKVGAGSNLFPQIRRIPSGRSRDSRAWEFCCDNEGSGELAMKAEQERSGSAAAAIQLIRSQSGRTLANITNKASQQLDTSSKSRKPSLSRSRTSMARLQSAGTPSFHLHEDHVDKQKSTLLPSRFVMSPSGESDKENHDPHHLQVTSTQRRPLAEKNRQSIARSSRKPTLKSSSTMPVGNSNARTGRKRSKYSPLVECSKENADPEDDAEIAQFMSGVQHPSSMSVEDEQDMDVIQGLLSLSKGS